MDLMTKCFIWMSLDQTEIKWSWICMSMSLCLASKWKIVWLLVHLVALNLHIPHGSVCYWHSACWFCCPVTFSWVCGQKMSILRRYSWWATSSVVSEIRPSQSDQTPFLNPFQLPPSLSTPPTKKAHLTLNFVIFPRGHGCLMLNTAGLNSWKVGFLPIRSKYERLMKELSCLRTSVACLEFSWRVSGYASVVNWFLSSRQSPTVGRIAPLLAVVGLYGCRHSRTSHWAGSKLSWLHFGKLAELN